jgi:hypothetical protein
MAKRRSKRGAPATYARWSSVSFVSLSFLLTILSKNFALLGSLKGLLKPFPWMAADATGTATTPTMMAMQSEPIPTLGVGQQQRERIHDNAKQDILHEALLQSGPDFQANVVNITFSAKFSLSAVGEVCFDFTVEEVDTKCPFPSIRVRLSGIALVNVPIKKGAKSVHASKLTGCALLPVPGVYYVDANIVHCRMNPYKERMTSESFKVDAARPIMPNLGIQFIPHQFQMRAFNRSHPGPAKRNAYPQHAWVFAPLCPNSLYDVGCPTAKEPPFMRTMIQRNRWFNLTSHVSWDDPGLHSRFDGYMWLPVSNSGVVDYQAEHSGYMYQPPPTFLAEKQPRHNQTILFIGASHARYLKNQVSQIYYNLTYNSDGCREEHTHPLDLDRPRFAHDYLRFADKYTNKSPEVVSEDGGTYFQFDKYIITTGHWDAGFPFKKPTPPAIFINNVLNLLKILDDKAKPGAEIFITTVNQVCSRALPKVHFKCTLSLDICR